MRLQKASPEKKLMLTPKATVFAARLALVFGLALLAMLLLRPFPGDGRYFGMSDKGRPYHPSAG